VEVVTAAASEVIATTLPTGWVATVDPSSGKTYYAHMESGKTSWEVPTEEPSAPEPAAGGGGGGDGGGASAAQTAAAASEKAAAEREAAAQAKARAKEKVKQTLTLSDKEKARWKEFLDFLRAEALIILNKKRERFMGLRKFAEIASKRKADAAAEKKRQEEEDAEEARKAALEEARPKSSILSLLVLEAPEVPHKEYVEYAESHFNLNRKGLFKTLTTVDKVLAWKNEVRAHAPRCAPPRHPTMPLHTPAPYLFPLNAPTHMLTPHPAHTRTQTHAHRLYPRRCSKCPQRTWMRRPASATKTCWGLWGTASRARTSRCTQKSSCGVP